MYSVQELPREKITTKGAAALSDCELLQVIIGSGGKGTILNRSQRTLIPRFQKSVQTT